MFDQTVEQEVIISHGRGGEQEQVEEVLEQLVQLNQVKIQWQRSEPKQVKLQCICSDGECYHTCVSPEKRKTDKQTKDFFWKIVGGYRTCT